MVTKKEKQKKEKKKEKKKTTAKKNTTKKSCKTKVQPKKVVKKAALKDNSKLKNKGKVEVVKEYHSDGMSDLVDDNTINELPEGRLKELAKELDATMEEIERVRDDNDADMKSYLSDLLEKASKIRYQIEEEQRKQ